MKRGQAWSVDLVIGVLIFLLVIGLFYTILTRNADEDTTQLKIESETIANKLTADSTGIVENGQISIGKVQTMTTKEAEELKAELGVENDFCIFFEDQAGNLIPIVIDDGGAQLVYHGIGSSTINVSGIACGDCYVTNNDNNNTLFPGCSGY